MRGQAWGLGVKGQARGIVGADPCVCPAQHKPMYLSLPGREPWANTRVLPYKVRRTHQMSIKEMYDG